MREEASTLPRVVQLTRIVETDRIDGIGGKPEDAFYAFSEIQLISSIQSPSLNDQWD